MQCGASFWPLSIFYFCSCVTAGVMSGSLCACRNRRICMLCCHSTSLRSKRLSAKQQDVPSNHGCDNNQSVLLGLSVPDVFLLWHVSARQEFQPPWSWPFGESWPQFNKHYSLVVKRGRLSSWRDVTVPREFVQPPVTCLAFLSTCSCFSFVLFFLFLSKRFPTYKTVEKSRNKLIALPWKYTLGSVCLCEYVLLAGRIEAVCCSALPPRSIGVNTALKTNRSNRPAHTFPVRS